MNHSFEFIIHKSTWKEGNFDSWEIMESNGRGFGRLIYLKDVKEYHLTDLFVDKKYREKGIATQIIRTAFNYIRDGFNLNTTIYTSTPDWLVHFYQKHKIVIKLKFNT